MLVGFILQFQAGGRMLGIQMIPNNVIVSEQVIMGREAWPWSANSRKGAGCWASKS